ncbi:MAG: enoyl-CoA hydratase/isomerase family protein [bacterium]|jgi:enoyl-CoA hydratase/carnithine racemase|nr:enoyl-CoA hydratase/isomerase family protein [bacterium]
MGITENKFNTSDNFFTTEEHGLLAVLRIKEQRGLFGDTIEQMELLWSYLERIEKSKRKLLLILMPRDFLRPEDMKEFWFLVQDVRERREAQEHTKSSWDLIRKENAFHHFAAVIRRIDTFVICAFQGETILSFLGIPLVCDYRLTTHDSRFRSCCIEAGLPPGGAFPWFLSRYVGQAFASRILYNEGDISAEQMREMGVVNRVVESENLEKAAFATAQRFAQLPTTGLIAAKRLMNATHLSLEEYLDLEEKELERCLYAARRD